ncbi:MAG: DNA repair protein RadC [Gammaproteobacteria bacterium]|jgi:DNA repair protein RadC
MAIADWPVHERPREKMLLRGAGALSDAELLAIFLRTGVKGKSAVDLARELLIRFGSLRGLLEADRQTFCDSPGLGEAKYIQLQATVEMSRRYLAEKIQRGDALQNPDDTRQYLMAQMRDHRQEVFACLYLDNRHRVISFDEMFYGTINMASVHPREIVQRALKHNASAVILSHNHPSGVAEPSTADIELTKQLQKALALVEVRVLDHVVVGDGSSVSFAERGWI